MSGVRVSQRARVQKPVHTMCGRFLFVRDEVTVLRHCHARLEKLLCYFWSERTEIAKRCTDSVRIKSLIARTRESTERVPGQQVLNEKGNEFKAGAKSLTAQLHEMLAPLLLFPFLETTSSLNHLINDLYHLVLCVLFLSRQTIL